jgi:hypothetical protein
MGHTLENIWIGEPGSMALKRIRIDKIASVTVNLNLDRELEVSEKIVPERGAVCVVRALEEKEVYDKLELANGRMAKISRGDIIAGVLGNRRALQGFVGVVPDRIVVHDTLNILNIGGVIGKAVSYNREYGQPLKVEVLGTAYRNGKPLSIKDGARRVTSELLYNRPLIVVCGTSMNCGKTVVASKLIQQLSWKGYRVGAAKVSGVSALKDILNMEDHGALQALSFLDYGYPSTVGTEDVPLIAKGALNDLEDCNPDIAVVELGDGLLGDYGVSDFFRDGAIKSAITCNIVCAIDPVGAWGMIEIMKHYGIKVQIVSGPVTDNIVGLDFVKKALGLRGINALTQKDKLGVFIENLMQGHGSK